MQSLECPFCHARLSLPASPRGKQVRCPRCGRVFTPGPSTPAGPASPTRDGASVFGAPDRGRAAGKSDRARKVALLVGGFAGIVLVVVLGAMVVVIRSRPTVEIRDRETGKVIRRQRMSRAEAERLRREDLAKAAERRWKRRGPQASPVQPADTSGRAGPAGAALPPVPKSDPNLDVGTPALVSGGIVGNTVYACGRVLNKYGVALETVTLTAYVDHARGPTVSYVFVPAGGSLRYCIPLGVLDPARAEVRIVAAGKKARADLVVWELDPQRMQSLPKEGKVVWTGTLHNHTTTPLKNVRVYCDFFDPDGIQGGSAQGGLVSAKTVGVGKSASFRVEFTDISAELYPQVVARAVAERY